MTKFKMPKFAIQLFAITIIAGFLMSSLPHLLSGPVTSLKTGFFSKLISPLPQTSDLFKPVQLKLQTKKNDYKLSKSNQFAFVPTSIAASDYENASAYVVADYESGQVLASKDSGKRMRIASLTKIMSSVVALDLASPNDLFAVYDDAVDITPTKMGVSTGQKYTVAELLQGALLTSANDAVQIIKDGVDEKYGRQNEFFVKAMNAKAEYIGLRNSTFDNPQGFDGPNHFSSAEDVAVLTRYALTNYSLIASIVKKDYVFLPETAAHKKHDLYNWNGLVGTYPGAVGAKIGNTEEAGYTTSVVAERGGRKVIVVLLGAPGVLERDLWASQLLDIGFGKLANLAPVELTASVLNEKYSSWKYW